MILECQNHQHGHQHHHLHHLVRQRRHRRNLSAAQQRVAQMSSAGSDVVNWPPSVFHPGRRRRCAFAAGWKDSILSERVRQTCARQPARLRLSLTSCSFLLQSLGIRKNLAFYSSLCGAASIDQGVLGLKIHPFSGSYTPLCSGQMAAS